MRTRLEPGEFEAPGDAVPRPHDECWWLLPGRLLAGRYPAGDDAGVRRRQLEALLDAGITYCIDLTHEREALPPYAEDFVRAAAARGRRVTTERHAIGDFSVPAADALRRTLASIDNALAEGDAVYLHCRAGIGRTGTVAACLLREQGLDADAADAVIRRKRAADRRFGTGARSHAVETDEQREFVERWSARR